MAVFILSGPCCRGDVPGRVILFFGGMCHLFTQGFGPWLQVVTSGSGGICLSSGALGSGTPPLDGSSFGPGRPKLKPRWDVHLSGDGDQLGCAGESLSSVLGE